MKFQVRSLGSPGSGIAMSYGVGCRCGSDSTLLWLWSRPAAVAPIGPLVWEPPNATGAALKRSKKKKKVTSLHTSKDPVECDTYF